MRASPSPFDLLQRLKPRERRVVVGGAIVCAVALTTVGLVLPIARRWSARQGLYLARTAQWARLTELNRNGGHLTEALAAGRRAFSLDEDRLVTGSTPALAASTIQALAQGYADEASVQLDRADAAGEPRPDQSGLMAIPLQLQMRGDLYGLVKLLDLLQHGEKLFVIDEFVLNSSGSDGALEGSAAPRTLSWTLRVHGLYAPDASQPGAKGS